MSHFALTKSHFALTKHWRYWRPEGRRDDKRERNHLGSIQSHAEAAGPGQHSSRGRIGPSFAKAVRQASSGAELGDQLQGFEADAHAQHNVGMPD